MSDGVTVQATVESVYADTDVRIEAVPKMLSITVKVAIDAYGAVTIGELVKLTGRKVSVKFQNAEES